jgi:glycosyltransferase involved in cell wall biosynthesis
MSMPGSGPSELPSVAFVLASYRPDEPAGIERSVAALAAGLRSVGGKAVIITAAEQPRPDPDVTVLRALPVTFPCDDATLRTAIRTHHAAVTSELGQVLRQLHADLVVYADALWGLGCIAAAVPHPARRVLAVHVVGHRIDLEPAVDAAQAVTTPSAAARAEASRAGYDTSSWIIVPNPLLIDPDDISRPAPDARELIRQRGRLAVIARLGAEKGVAGLLAAAPPRHRPADVVLAAAGFEAEPGAQSALLARCRRLASQAGGSIRPALPWQDVPAFLSAAALTMVPSVRETFGNTAAESLSAGTPVIAYETGNLPALIGDAGILVPPAQGPAALWESAALLLADPVRYSQVCGAAYCRSRNYRPASIADDFVKAVWQK